MKSFQPQSNKGARRGRDGYDGMRWKYRAALALSTRAGFNLKRGIQLRHHRRLYYVLCSVIGTAVHASFSIHAILSKDSLQKQPPFLQIPPLGTFATTAGCLA